MNLTKGLQKELNRVRELKTQYEAIGSSGFFGVSMINQAISRAEKAIEEGDIVKETVAYKELTEITG